MPGNGKNAEEWTSQDKFGVVLETAGLNEAELAEYCRRKGLFIEQIVEWRSVCQEANTQPAERTRAQREQSKSDCKRIKQLEKELLPIGASDRLKFVTPVQRHAGHAQAILRHREQVYEAARQRCPERWSGVTRNWKLKDEVWLNPERA